MVPLLQKTKLNWLGLGDRYRRQLAVAFVLGLAPLVASATATVVNKFEPDTINPGDISTYTLTVKNSANVQLTDVALSSFLGNDVKVVGLVSDTCNFASKTVSTTAPYGVVLSGGVTPAQVGTKAGECVVTYQVTSTKSGNHVANVPADTAPSASQSGFSATEGSAQIKNSTPTTVTLLVDPVLAPSGTKRFPDNAYEGAPFPLTITLNNNSDEVDLQLTEFIDNLPAGMTVASPAYSSVTACNGAPTITAVPGSSEIKLTGGSMSKLGACEFVVNVVVSTLPSGAAKSYTNVIGSGAIKNNRDLVSEPFQSTVNVLPAVGLKKEFLKADNSVATVVPVGYPTRMKITITNNGSVPLVLTPEGMTDNLPAGMKLANPPGGVVTCSAGGAPGTLVGNTADSTVLTLSGATVPASITSTNPATPGTCVVEANVVMTGETSLTNTLPANSIKNEGNISSPSASAPLQAFGQLQLEKRVAPANVAPGQWAEYTIVINNYSSYEVLGTSITDKLPKYKDGPPIGYMELDYSAAPSSTCQGFAFTQTGTANYDGANELKGTGGIIPAATGINPGTCAVTFRARLPLDAANGSYTNQLNVGDVTGTSAGPNGGAVGNTDTPSQGVTVVDAISIGKRFTGSTVINNVQAVGQGQSATLRIDIVNRLVTSLTSINLTDNFPAGLTLAADPQPFNTCGGSLEARPSSTVLKLTGATVAARSGAAETASCYIEVQVTGKTTGTYLNEIKGATDFSSSSTEKPQDVGASLTIFAGLSADKSFSPAAVAPGAVSRATVRIKNGTNAQVTNVTMVDKGLVGMQVANPANAATTCSGSANLTANAGTTEVHLAGATIPAGASCDVSFDVLATGPAPMTNTIHPNEITSTEGAFNSSEVKATLGTTDAQLSLNKSFSKNFLQGNEPTILKLTLSNSSNVAMVGVSLTDSFPAGMVVYSVPDVSTTCTGATVAATPGGTKAVVTGANIPPGQRCEAFVTVTSHKYLNLINTIPAGAVSSQGGFTNADPAIATVSTLEGLGVSKGFAPATIPPGGKSRLTITLINTFSPLTPRLTGVSFTDNLPAGLKVANPANVQTTCADGKVLAGADSSFITLTGATLSQNQSCQIQVDVTADDIANYRNEIPTGGVTTTEGATNEVPGISTLVVDEGTGVSKSFLPTVVAIGATSKLTVTVKNNANFDLTGVSMADNLPSGMNIANPPNGNTTCAGGAVNAKPGDERVTLTGARVPTKGSCQFSVDVISSQSGVLVNTIAKDAIKSNQGLTNGDPTDAPLTVLTPPSVNKSFFKVQINPGETSMLAINLVNPNATPITLTKLFADALPADVFVANPALLNDPAAKPATAKYPLCTGTTLVADGGTRITHAKDSVIPAKVNGDANSGGCSIWVAVTSNLGGSYLNKIESGQLQTTAGFNPEPAIATLGVGKPAPPTIKKSFSTKVINPGDPTTLTIEMFNPNEAALKLTEDLVDTFPVGMQVATPTNFSTTCDQITAPVMTVTAGEGKIVIPKDSILTANTGCSVTVNVTATAFQVYKNVIIEGALKTTGGSNPEETSDGVTVVPENDPEVKKVFSPNPINVNEISTLTITLKNTSARVATLTAPMVDNLPLGLVAAENPNLGGTCNDYGSIEAGLEMVKDLDGNFVRKDYVVYGKDSKIPALGECTITIDVTSSVAKTYTNIIETQALQTDRGFNQAPAPADLVVLPDAPPSVSKLFFPERIVPGGTSGLLIMLNGGLSGATLTKDMTDNLPDDMTIVDVISGVAGLCDANFIVAVPGTKMVTYKAGGPIPAGTGCSIAVNVTSSTPGIRNNVIPSGSLQTDKGTYLDPATASVEVIPPQLMASISGNVYHDRDNNGLIGKPTEEGVGGVEVKLYRQNGSLIEIATTVTKPDGSYSFPGLVPADGYVVRVTHPSGWINGKDTPGSKGGDVSPTDVTKDEIININLKDRDAGVEYNFGLRKPPTLSGKVYHDRDDNGTIDPKDEGVGGVTIKITWPDPANPSGPPIEKTTTTNPDGTYSFTDLPPDTTFKVTKVHPTDWINGKDTAGTHGGTVTEDVIAEVTLRPEDEAKEYNFGLRKPATLSGKVYHDRSDDGKVDPKEEGVGDVTITITWTDKTTGKTVTKETKTDPSGNYTFTDLPPDTEYTVTKKHPDGWINGKDTAGTHGGTVTDDVIGKVTLTSGDEAKEYNYGLRKKASIAGKVYHDKNDDGDLNAKDVGVADVEVQLTWVDASGTTQTKSTKTAADGSYSFPDLEADLEYTVTKVHPKGWEDRKDNVGSHGGVANQDDVISTIKLSSGDQGVEYNFGLYRKEVDLNPVPTMSQWGLILMSLMLMGFAAVRQRKTLNQRQ